MRNIVIVVLYAVGTKLYRAVIEAESYSEHCQSFKMERFAKRIMPECSGAARKFSGQEKFHGTKTLR